jgi:hypothetical protein
MRSKQAPSWLPLVFTVKNSGRKDYSQGSWGTQGKNRKKCPKIAVFLQGMWKSPVKMRNWEE